MRLLAPPAGSRLAVALGPGTHVYGAGKRIGYVATGEATVRITIAGKALSQTSRAGRNEVSLNMRLLAGHRYRVKLTAKTADGQVAVDYASVVAGPALTLAVAKRAASDAAWKVIPIVESGETAEVGACRRFGEARVDCRLIAKPEWDSGVCVGVASITVRSEGQTYFRRYRSCRFQARPNWSNPHPLPTGGD